MPRGRPRKTPPPMLPRTEEVKLEEAREAVVEKILDPENITPERMPNIANLDSYGKFAGLEEPSAEAKRPDESDDIDYREFECDGGVVEIDHTEEETPSEFPKQNRKSRFSDNIKMFNKLTSEISDLKSKLEISESELEDTKNLLEDAISEKKRLSDEVSSLKSELENSVSIRSNSVPREKYDKVVSENEMLVLRNSELELEATIAKESSKMKECLAATQPATYSFPGYAEDPNRPKPKCPPNARPSMNGYQDWI